MTEFVRFNALYEHQDAKTKARTRYPAGWAGEVDATVTKGGRAAGAIPAAAGTADEHFADDPIDLDKMSKDELLAEAERRGVEVKPSDTKAEIIKALEAK